MRCLFLSSCHRALALGLFITALFSLGCSDSAAPEPAPDLSEVLFDPTNIIAVEIEMAPADWEIVRNDTRDLSGMSGPDCMTEPLYSTYVYKSATVTINGQVLENVGVRKKGFVGSVSDVKPGLKIKLDKYVDGQTLYGKERLTLNNNTSDPAFLRQCLTYGLFRKAGLPAPRCNFATVKVNGEDMGLYTNVEAVKKRFLKRHFKDNDGDLYEGSLSDFRDDWHLSYEDKLAATDKSHTKIKAIVAALELDDDALVAALTPLIDMDQFYRYWAMEVLIRHPDGYTNEGNNHFIYFDPGDDNKLHFIPWGVDKSLLSSAIFAQDVFARTILPRRLYNFAQTQAKYVTAMKALVADIWDEDAIVAEIDRMEQLVGAMALEDPYFEGGHFEGHGGKDGKGDWDFAASVEELREFVTARRSEIQKFVDAPPAWTDKLQEYNCEGGGEATYEISGTFATSYGTIDSPDPFAAGSGTLELVTDGKPTKILKVGAEAGPSGKDPGEVAIRVYGELEDDTLAYLQLGIMPEADVVLGKPIVCDNKGVYAAFLGFDPSTKKTELLGFINECELIVDKLGSTNGDAVEGTFTGKTSAKGGK